MTSLYDFGQAMQAQIDHVTDLLESGLEPDSIEVQQALKDMVTCEGDFNSKAEKLGLYIRQLLAEGEAAKVEADRLTKLAKSKSTRADNIKNNLLHHMVSLGIEEVKSPICPIKTKLNPWSVQVENAENLPPQFQRVKTIVEADKKALLSARETSDGLPGVRFDRAMSIRIG